MVVVVVMLVFFRAYHSIDFQKGNDMVFRSHHGTDSVW